MTFPTTRVRRITLAATAAVLCALTATGLAQRGAMTPELAERRWALEKELASIAVVDRKVMLPMRDGVRLATDVYRPKDASAKVPAIFVRTPYNFNFWDVRNGVPSDMNAALTAVKRGYAYVVQNERGHFFSEGHYDILGSPADGYDTLAWISAQPWSNGKVGTTGCSSTAEYQMGVAALGHPAYAAMNVQGFGAGVGRVRPYFEQGNWYRGGAVQMLFITWLYGVQNQVRPMFPPGTPQEDLIRASKSFDLAQQQPRGGLVQGALAPADPGHPEGRRRPARHLRRRDARADRRAHDAAHAERPGLVQGRALPRRPVPERARTLVHVLVRRVGGPEPRAVQPRPPDRQAGHRGPAVGRDRARGALQLLTGGRKHRGGRAEHGRRPAGTTKRSPTGSSTGSSRAKRARPSRSSRR